MAPAFQHPRASRAAERSEPGSGAPSGSARWGEGRGPLDAITCELVLVAGGNTDPTGAVILRRL